LTTFRKTMAAPLAAALIAATTLSTVGQAAPISTPKAAATLEDGVSKVDWRYRGGRRYWNGPGIGLGILGGVVAGAIIADAVRERRATPYAMDRCAHDFGSFDYRTGTYITYYGEVRVCPYLR